MSVSLQTYGSVLGVDARERAIERRAKGFTLNGGALYSSTGKFVGWSQTHGLGSLVAHDVKLARQRAELDAALRRR